MSHISHLPTAAAPRPTRVNRKVVRRPNADYRTREHLTEDEVERMLKAVPKVSRNPTRDRLLLLMAYRHGLRVKELLGLTWQDVDFKTGRLNVRRAKNGLDTTHPLQGDTLRLLRQLQRESKHERFIFMSERGAPLSASSVRFLVRKAGDAAEIGFPVHPHMLRHATGYYLANKGFPSRISTAGRSRAIDQITGRLSVRCCGAINGGTARQNRRLVTDLSGAFVGWSAWQYIRTTV